MLHLFLFFLAARHAVGNAGVCDRISPAALDTLKKRFSGQIVTRNDPSYSNVTQMNSKLFHKRPCIILLCRSTSDVQVGMHFSAEMKLKISIRSGGHNYMGWSLLDDSVALDLRDLDRIEVEKGSAFDTVPGSKPYVSPSEWVVNVGPGAKSDVVVKLLSEKYKLQTSTGGCPTVALGGFLLGGGHPIIARSTGAGVDNIIGMEVVLANGTSLNVSAREFPDLYWGLRGGCGSAFGIVTNFRLRAYHECGGQRCGGGHITYAIHDAAKVAAVFATYVPRADPRLGLEFFVESPAQSPSTGGGAVITGVFNGPASEYMAALHPLLTIHNVTILENTWTETQSYYEAWHAFGGPRDPKAATRREVIKSAFYALPLPFEVWSELVDEFVKFNVLGSVGMNAMGGSWSAPDVDAAAYPHRKFLFNAIINPIWYDESQDERIMNWSQRAYEKYYKPQCSPDGCEVYCNYPDGSLPNFPAAYWGANANRLSVLRQQWDPTRVFGYPQSIPPVQKPKHWGGPRFLGKRVLVTGGDSGIGFATVQAFYLECASVAIAGHNEDKARAAFDLVAALPLPKSCTTSSGRQALVWVAFDATNSSSVTSAIQQAVSKLGGLDVAVNAAGISGDGGISEREIGDPGFVESFGTHEDALTVNVYGTLRCMNAELRHFVEAGVQGSIVNVGSICGEAYWCWGPLYMTSKTALIGFTKQAALAYAKRGIRVNAVDPGWTNTSMLRQGLQPDDPVWLENLKTYEASAPLGRIAEPWEIAGPITFLSSDMASYVTGVALNVDGYLTGASPVHKPKSLSREALGSQPPPGEGLLIQLDGSFV